MIAYHGSIKTNLKELMPFAKKGATVSEPCVYLTTDKALAALYIWDKPYYWFTYGFTKEGLVKYTEYFPDSLRYFYGGRSGSIYTVEGSFENASQTGIKSLVLSKSNVNILKEDFIADAFDYILKLEKEGKIIIRRFHELDERMLNYIRETVKAEKASTDCPEQKEFFAEKFSEI